MKRPKNKTTRWLRRNCFKIPFWAAFVAMLVITSHYCDGNPHEPKNGDLQYVAVYAQEFVEATAEQPNCTGGVEEMIIEACQWYGIDHQIPVAVAKLETDHFTSQAYQEYNNVGGMSLNEEPIAYATLTDGVDAFVKNLSENYFAEGLETPEAISRKYCPVNADGWARAVREIMEENANDKE